MDFRLEQLHQLHWLWAVAVAAALLIYAVTSRRRLLHRFASSHLLAALTPRTSFARKWMKAVLLIVALLALVAAMLDPRWGSRYEEVEQRGIDIVFILDVSRSMLAEDVRPNRLERAKQYIGDVLDRLGGDRVALITSAGVPAIRCPLTVDYGAMRLILDEIEPESAARGGSLIGDAIRLAGEAFADEVKDYKAVIVLSDGEDHGSFPVEAAADLHAQLGVRIHTVGLGDAERGARIPITENGGTRYLTYQGEQVWSKMNREQLQEIAQAGGGVFVPAGTQYAEMGRIFEDRIGPASKRKFETTRIRQFEPRYQWFAGFALLVLLVETWLGDRKPTSAREVVRVRAAA
jgi:Ca-activated chloride channel family protein